MIGRSPIYVLSISRNYGGLILLTALQTTITKKVEIFFLEILESQFQWSGLFCTKCGKRELFGSSACNHDYEGHPLLVCSRAVGTVIVPFWPSAYFWPVITRKFRKYIRDIAICEQNMATNSVKESTSKADRS